jgi:hypothetical protein
MGNGLYFVAFFSQVSYINQSRSSFILLCSTKVWSLSADNGELNQGWWSTAAVSPALSNKRRDNKQRSKWPQIEEMDAMPFQVGLTVSDKYANRHNRTILMTDGYKFRRNLCITVTVDLTCFDVA